MATVNVTSWEQFVQAVSVSGDTVVLPSNALWDMNELYPEGITGNVTVNCAAINGNNTEIRNLHLYGKFIVNNNLVMSNVIFKNVITESTAFIEQGSNYREITMNRCIITGLSGLNTLRFIYGPVSMTRCTMNVDLTPSTSSEVYFVQLSFDAIYCRISIKYPLYTGPLQLFASTGGLKFCYININAIGVSQISSYWFSGCVVTGNYGNATDAHSSYRPAFVSVYDVAAFSDGFVPDTDYFKPVTQSQLYDAVYLAGIGFPIGV